MLIATDEREVNFRAKNLLMRGESDGTGRECPVRLGIVDQIFGPPVAACFDPGEFGPSGRSASQPPPKPKKQEPSMQDKLAALSNKFKVR